MLADRNELKTSNGAVSKGGAFATMKVQQRSCHSFCWKARHRFDVPFFYVLPAPIAGLSSPLAT